eukprot:gene8377-17275_t
MRHAAIETVITYKENIAMKRLQQTFTAISSGNIFRNFVRQNLFRMRLPPSSTPSVSMSHIATSAPATTSSRKDRLVAVIIEPRVVIELEYCVRNVMYYLGEQWSLRVHHSTGRLGNEMYVRTVLADLETVAVTETYTRGATGNGDGNENRRNRRHITFIPLTADVFDQNSYSTLLLSLSFWNDLLLYADKVLIFQSDTLMLRHGIDAYLKFNYIGAPWNVKYHPWLSFHNRQRRLIQGVGNGGFSLRDVHIMINILKRNQTYYTFEDVEIAQRAEKMKNFPHRFIAYTFAIECPCDDIPLQIDFSEKIPFIPLGIHKVWAYFSHEQALHLLELSLI